MLPGQGRQLGQPSNGGAHAGVLVGRDANPVGRAAEQNAQLRRAAFYGRLGFETVYRDEGWIILRAGTLQVEFFPWPDLDPLANAASCCLRLDDVDAFCSQCAAAGIAETTVGWPRIHPPRIEASGMRIGALVDPDGTLLRLVQNPEPGFGGGDS